MGSSLGCRAPLTIGVRPIAQRWGFPQLVVESAPTRRFSRRATTRLHLKDGMTDDDKPITLKQASEEFPFTVSTLRAEADRGRLTIYQIGRRHYTTRADIRGMVQKCRVEPRVRDSISIRKEANGSSVTERFFSAQAAANETVQRLKNSSRNTSAVSISPSHRGRR